MKQILLPLSVLFLLSSCATPKPKVDEPIVAERFIFADTISTNTANSVRDYNSHIRLENGLEYGSFVRNFRLTGESYVSLKKKLKKSPCKFTEDVIREPKENKPVKDALGKTSPIWLWVCNDGGTIRVKPFGDPTSKYQPQAHGSKTLRYPPMTKNHSFNDETAKIDEDGNILPKWPADLKSKDPTVIRDWAQAVHTDLAPLNH